jgi:hypothetical protein
MTYPRILLVDHDQNRFNIIQELFRSLIPDVTFVHSHTARTTVDATGMLRPDRPDFPVIACFIHASVQHGPDHPALPVIEDQANFGPAIATSRMLQARGILPPHLIFGVVANNGDLVSLADTGAFAKVVTHSLFSGDPRLVQAALPGLFPAVTQRPFRDRRSI